MMDEKLNSQLVQEYSSTCASSMAEGFFSKKGKIDGNEIASFCDIPQINLFVVRELLKVWKQESQKYKSPYFDYEAVAVKDALEHFCNTLSNHISIARDHFTSLLQKGISLTIYLILSPYDFYSYTLNKYGNRKIMLDHLKNEIKYIKINNAPLEELVHKLEKQGLNSIAGNEAFLLFEQVLEEVNFTPVDVGPHIAQLDKEFPLNVSKLYESREGVSAIMPFQDNTISAILSDKHTHEKPVTTVAENYQKISLLKDWLNINQKFMFTKMLFNGNFESFSHAITQIDNLSSFDDAVDYLDSHYSNWNRKSEEYEEFIKILDKRFN